MTREYSEATRGGAYATVAYGLWGVLALYYKLVAHVSATEILAHRVLWGTIVVGALLGVTRRFSEVRAVFRDSRLLGRLAISAALVATNWLIFVYSVATNRVLEVSLGYYINPLLNVLLGRLFLGELLSKAQGVAVVIAAAGVATLLVGRGEFPVLALALAGSFALYGLARKTTNVPAVVGFEVEVLLLLLPSLGYMGWLASEGSLAFGSDLRATALLPLAGLATAVPLICFANAARRLTLTTLGFFQYIAPSLQFALAVLVFGEEFTRTHALAFALLWIALAIYSVDANRRRKGRRNPAT